MEGDNQRQFKPEGPLFWLHWLDMGLIPPVPFDTVNDLDRATDKLAERGYHEGTNFKVTGPF